MAHGFRPTLTANDQVNVALERQQTKSCSSEIRVLLSHQLPDLPGTGHPNTQILKLDVWAVG